MNLKLQRGLPALLTLAVMAICQGGTPAQAESVGGVSIIGVFSNPVTSGVLLNYPAVGDLYFEDNSLTFATGAGSSTTDPVCASSSGICWGTDSPAGPDTYSELSFTGSVLPSVPTGVFQVGTLTFLNGTSSLPSVIFGATLSFYENSVSAPNYLGSDLVIISTTSNQYSGLGLTQAQLQLDADYVNICGNQSNICGDSIEAYEDSEGGTSLTVDLDGNLVGDPQLILDDVNLDLSTNPLTGGAIGNLPALGNTPEPSTWIMLGTGLLGFGRMVRRKMSR